MQFTHYCQQYSAGETQQNQQQPNIKASNIFQTQNMVFGKNIKNLIIEIPNEGHEDPTQPKELRVVNQPYLPRNAIVNAGTTVTWFNADAGHKHQIMLLDNKSGTVVYDSGLFDNVAAQTPLSLIIRVLLLTLVQVMIKQFQTIK